jgi:hypothetical protein
MAVGFDMMLGNVRAHAKQMRELASHAVATDPYPEFWRYACDLATRWSEAVSADSLDWQVLGQLREEARTEKHRAGVWLFYWCNGLESDYVALREASLSLRERRIFVSRE